MLLLNTFKVLTIVQVDWPGEDWRCLEGKKISPAPLGGGRSSCDCWCCASRLTVCVSMSDCGVRPSSPATNVAWGTSASTQLCWSWKAATPETRWTSTWGSAVPTSIRPRSKRHLRHLNVFVKISAPPAGLIKFHRPHYEMSTCFRCSPGTESVQIVYVKFVGC